MASEEMLNNDSLKCGWCGVYNVHPVQFKPWGRKRVIIWCAGTQSESGCNLTPLVIMGSEGSVEYPEWGVGYNLPSLTKRCPNAVILRGM